MKAFRKNAIGLLLAIIGYQGVSAQEDDLLKLSEQSEQKQKEFVQATFKGTRVINFHTPEVGGKRTLDLRISHRFGDFNQGIYQFFGLDGGASIRIGLEYSYDGRLQAGLGRTSYEKAMDGFLKYRLLRQTSDNSMPLSITLFSSMFSTLLRDANKQVTGFDRYAKTSARFAYAHQVILARKFNSHLSLQVAPTIVHINQVDKAIDPNTTYAVGFAGRYKFTKRMAVTAEYGLRLNKYKSVDNYDSMGLGLDIETGGHVFQIHVTNSFGLTEHQFLPRTTSSWTDGGIRLGFNVSRVFTI